MTRSRMLMALATLGCVGALLAAFGFQYGMGLIPCEMCVWQRWPHVAGGVLGAAALSRIAPLRAMAALGALALLIGAGLGLWHAGVEQGWWEGLTACSSDLNPAALSVDDLMAQIRDAPLVRCDEIAWEFLGLSMAAWNGLLSLGLAGLFAGAYASSSASQ